jgi:hypothetical protein
MSIMCWTVEAGRLRPCPRPGEDYASLVCLHTHSCYSTEDLAGLNWVVRLPYMRPLKTLLQRAFGFGDVPDVDYRHLCYNPPFRPADIWALERASIARLGAQTLLLAITDHDVVDGGRELFRELPEHRAHIGLGEELSIRFEGHLFHLGISGIPASHLDHVHVSLQASAQADHLDAVFEQLAAEPCLVVLNHPLLSWGGGSIDAAPALSLLRRYGWAIDALEVNGMRSHDENQRVIALASRSNKPLVGGGDSHLLIASGALCGSQAETYDAFVAEVKGGWSRPLLIPEYFFQQRWKMMLRVLSFIAQYRRIAHYRGEPVADMLAGRRVWLDPIGTTARSFLAIVDRLGWMA